MHHIHFNEHFIFTGSPCDSILWSLFSLRTKIQVNWDTIWCFILCQEMNREKSSKSVSIGKFLVKHLFIMIDMFFRGSNYTMEKYKWGSLVWSCWSWVGLENCKKRNSRLHWSVGFKRQSSRRRYWNLRSWYCSFTKETCIVVDQNNFFVCLYLFFTFSTENAYLQPTACVLR